MIARIATQTQLAELEQNAPGSPAIPSLRARVAALNAQLDGTMRSVTGSGSSVAGKLGGYETLELSKEIAGKLLASATQSLQTARQEARAKHLYVEHVAEPNLPDYPLFPRRLFYFLITMVSALLVYGIAWLLFASIREHGDA
jgi:capsular polysaccharide transport system permease protein